MVYFVMVLAKSVGIHGACWFEDFGGITFFWVSIRDRRRWATNFYQWRKILKAITLLHWLKQWNRDSEINGEYLDNYRNKARLINLLFDTSIL